MNAAQLTAAFNTLAEQVGGLRRDRDAAIADVKRLEAALHAAQTDLAVLRKQYEEHTKRYELWEARRWAFVMALVGAVLSLASGLIVTLARTTSK